MAGFAPGGALTFFASPKKVSQERRAAVSALRVPCAARSGRGRVQTRFAQTSTRPDPPAAALLSPARTAWRPFRALLRSPPEFKTRGFSGLVGTLGFFLYVHHQCSHQRRGCGLGRFGELASMSPSPQPRLWFHKPFSQVSMGLTPTAGSTSRSPMSPSPHTYLWQPQAQRTCHNQGQNEIQQV